MHVKGSVVLLVISTFLSYSAALAERVSINSAGREARGDSHTPAISADGRYVAFATTAKLVKEDTNGVSDVYVYDRKTNKTKLVTDPVGGDQPSISANGRFVAFRSFEYYEGLPRVRIVDLERGGPSFSGAVQNLNSYYQPAGAPLMSANGRFLAFAFSPSPNLDGNSFRDFEITVVDLLTRFPYPILGATTDAAGLTDLGQFSMSADSHLIVFETKDRAVAGDANTTSDVYIVERDKPAMFTRLSIPKISGANASTPSNAHHPVITFDGSKVFFIADSPLTNDDTDDRATIYSISAGGNANTLVPINTKATPIALAPRATISGKYLAYLGQPEKGPARPFVINLEDGTETPLAAGGNGESEAPVLSGDDHFAVYASAASNLVGGDTNRSFDIFAEVPRNAPPARKPPLVTLTMPTDGDRPAKGTAFPVGSSATDGSGTIPLQTFELNGWPVVSGSGPILQQTYTPPTLPQGSNPPPTFIDQFYQPGLFTAQARAFNDAWIEGRSAIANLTVRDTSAVIAVAGIEDLQRVDAADGSTTFDVTLAIENRGNSATPDLRLVVTAASTAFSTNPTIDLSTIQTLEEQVITYIDIPPMKALERRSVRLRGVTPKTIIGTLPTQGLGWTLLANLRSGATLYNSFRLFQVSPVLSENTFLPNGGIPSTGNPGADNQFNPTQLQGIQIQGRANLVAGVSAAYTARAMFNNLPSKSCLPVWSVNAPSGGVTISPTGVLRSGNIAAPMTVSVRASFGGQTAVQKVKIKPASPKVSVLAASPDAQEGGTSGQFKITRTGPLSGPLTVNYSVSGTATPQTDYGVLPGTVTIPAGASSATIDVLPVNDATSEGFESVIVTLLPDALYRLSSFITATVTIADNDPYPTGQPDITLAYKDQDAIGLRVFDADPPVSSGLESSQIVEVDGIKNRTEQFTATVVNEETVQRTYTVRGAFGTIGYTAQYFAGDQDITVAMTAGTYSVTLAAGQSSPIRVEITPTAAAGVGTWFKCDLRVQNNATFKSDLATAEVYRAK